MKEAHNVLPNVYGFVKITRATYAILKYQKYD